MRKKGKDMKVSFQVGPRNEDFIELARKALNNGGNCYVLKEYLSQFMTYSQMADALYYLTGENQALMEKNVGVYEAVVDGFHSAYMEKHKVYDF